MEPLSEPETKNTILIELLEHNRSRLTVGTSIYYMYSSPIYICTNKIATSISLEQVPSKTDQRSSSSSESQPETGAVIQAGVVGVGGAVSGSGAAGAVGAVGAVVTGGAH